MKIYYSLKNLCYYVFDHEVRYTIMMGEEIKVIKIVDMIAEWEKSVMNLFLLGSIRETQNKTVIDLVHYLIENYEENREN